MTISTQQYAHLASHSYGEKHGNLDGQMQHLVGKNFKRDGVEYEVLEYMDRPSGYQGAIYQRVDTGEIVVAHRGTEFDREATKDGLIADGGMVTMGVNAQVKDAMELTRRALEHARKTAPNYDNKNLEVTTTGHSLGGCLAQVTAHKFGLRGEAFNPYGAASLDHGVPKGGDRFVNHVMAGDAVSAASPHYGQVRVYAKPEEIGSLQAAGYNNHDRVSTDLLHRAPLVAAVSSGTRGRSHQMDNFLNVDGDGRRDVSVLGDPTTQALARHYDPMIDKFRDDVRYLRTGLTATVAAGEKIVELQHDAVRRGIDTGVQTGRIATAAAGKVLETHEQATRAAVEVGVHAGRKVVETGEQAIELAGKAGRKAAEIGEQAGRKAHEVGDAIGGLLDSRAASVGAAGTALLSANPLAFVRQMAQAHASGDREGFRAMTQSAAEHGAGRQLRHDAGATLDRQEQQQAAERAAAQQQQHETAQPSHGGRSR